MKKLILSFLLLCSTTAIVEAAPYVHQTLFVDGMVQNLAPDPLQTVLITDNFSHTVNVSTKLWYDLIYRGSGTCLIRLMNTATKASWAPEVIPANGTHSYTINSNTNYINYSGCNGGTSPTNSILHIM